MNYLFSLLLITMVSSALANEEKIECKKGNDTITSFVGRHMGKGPTLSDVSLNGSWNDDGINMFTEILLASKKCIDLTGYVDISKLEVLICDGEMFAPKGIYGQILMSSKGIEVFKTSLAPASGWICN